MLPLTRLWSAVGGYWCAIAHREITTPISGHYRCLRCSRVFPVLWGPDRSASARPIRQIPSFRPSHENGKKAA
jgi:hypothetical protein